MDQQATRQGFFYGYLIVGASSIIQMMFLSCMFAYGVLFKELESEFGWSRAAIAGAPSLMMLMMGTLGIFLGRVNDVAGPRLLLTLTGVLYGVGFMLMYQMNSLWELYLFFGAMGGLGLASATNESQRGVQWQFTIEDARTRLISLYPKIIN